MVMINDLILFFEKQNTATAYVPDSAQCVGTLLAQFENFSDKKNEDELFQNFRTLFCSAHKYKSNSAPDFNLGVVEPLHRLDVFIFYFIAKGLLSRQDVLKILDKALPGSEDKHFQKNYNNLILSQNREDSHYFWRRFMGAVKESEKIRNASKKIKNLYLLPEELNDIYLEFLERPENVLTEQGSWLLEGVKFFYALPEDVKDLKSLQQWRKENYQSELMRSFILLYGSFCGHVSILSSAEKAVFDEWCARPWLQSQQELIRLRREFVEYTALQKFSNAAATQDSYIAAFMARGYLTKAAVVQKFKKGLDIFDEIPGFWARFEECCQEFKKEDLDLLSKHEAFKSHQSIKFSQYFYVYKYLMPNWHSEGRKTVQTFLEELPQGSAVETPVVHKESLIDRPDLFDVFCSDKDFFRRTLAVCFLMDNKDFLLVGDVKNSVSSNSVSKRLNFDSPTSLGLLNVDGPDDISQEEDDPKLEASQQAAYDDFIEKHQLTKFLIPATAIKNDLRFKQAFVLLMLENRHYWPEDFILLVARLDLGTAHEFCRRQLPLPKAISFWSKTPKKIVDSVDSIISRILKGERPSLERVCELLTPTFVDESFIELGDDTSLNDSLISGLFSPIKKTKTPAKVQVLGELRLEDIKRASPAIRAKKQLTSSPLKPWGE